MVEPGTSGLAQVVGRIRRGRAAADGSLNRARLGEIVFGDAARREKLNAIIHPLVGARIRELEEAADRDAIVVQDVPLLAENDLAASSTWSWWWTCRRGCSRSGWSGTAA